MQLAIPLSKGKGPLFRQVYTGLRESILVGTLTAGSRLPSTRDLADQLKLSRTVVLLAYEQLLAEGFVRGRHGSGTFVAQGVSAKRNEAAKRSTPVKLSEFGAAAGKSGAGLRFSSRSLSSLRYDFACGRSESDIETFPFAMWRRILLRQARKSSLSELDYGNPAGSLALREAIASHVARSRAVICDASEIIVVNGSQQALDLIVRVLLERGDRVAIENPSYQGTREILEVAGARLLPVPVDQYGMRPDGLPDEARMCFVTPSHQFPTGAILTLPRRMALLAWAKRKNAVIVEDDYDGEFRYEGHPLESLQGLDREGRTIYVGTFSRTIFPALRVGYLIVPRPLVPAFTAAKWLNDQHSPTLEQETLAEFIASGMYERYLRRVRRRNASRRQTLLEAAREHLGDRVEMTGDGAGAHVVLWPKQRVSEETLIQAAESQGVAIYGVSRYYLKRPLRPGIMLGYSRMREAEIREGMRRLGKVFWGS